MESEAKNLDQPAPQPQPQPGLKSREQWLFEMKRNHARFDCEASDDIAEILGALALAQGEILPAAKTAHNPFFDSWYADFAAVQNVARGPLAKNGLAVVQILRMNTTPAHDGFPPIHTLLTLLGHKSGQWFSSKFPVEPQMVWNKKAQSLELPGPQETGAAVTYARRYAYSAIVGVATEDDDGNQASGKQNPHDGYDQRPQQTRPPPPAQQHQQTTATAMDKPRGLSMLEAFEKIGVTRADIEQRFGVTVEQLGDMAIDNLKGIYRTVSADAKRKSEFFPDAKNPADAINTQFGT